jgi:hypothetical protein
LNEGWADLNLLRACFVDRHFCMPLGTLRRLIDRNAEVNGWLIFVAHDVSESTRPFGCSPAFFQSLVRYSAESGALLLTMSEALARLTGNVSQPPQVGDATYASSLF